MFNEILEDLKKFENKDKKEILPKFFKTGTGEYGEGDRFLGVTVPNIRVVAKKHIDFSFEELLNSLKSKFHEERLCALIILTYKYQKSKTQNEKLKIYTFYLNNIKYVNNWDLVDLSAYKIVGDYIYNYSKDFKLLQHFSMSSNLWERRIAIISTFYYIKNKDYFLTLKISKLLLNDTHDLIHKAVGWMLREVGKNCGEDILKKFLKENYLNLPRTTLRYSIEKFSQTDRRKYLSGNF